MTAEGEDVPAEPHTIEFCDPPRRLVVTSVDADGSTWRMRLELTLRRLCRRLPTVRCLPHGAILLMVGHEEHAMPRAMQKRSVTLDPDVAKAVEHHVHAGAAESFSAAINEAASRWAANRDLREALDAVYAEDPDARPSEKQVAAAAARVAVAADGVR